MGNVKHIYRNPNIVKKSSNPAPAQTKKNKVEKEDSYEEILMSKEPQSKKFPGVYINNDYDINTVDNSENEDNDDQSRSKDLGDYDDDKLIYSSEEKMMISITGNTESVFSNKLRIEVNSKHEDKKAYTPYTPMTGGNPPPPQSKVWTNFAGAELRGARGETPAISVSSQPVLTRYDLSRYPLVIMMINVHVQCATLG